MIDLYLAIFFLASFLWYTLYYRPTRLLNTYQKNFQAKGYRVYRLPFHPFSFPLFDLIKKDQQRFGDALKTVKELTKYDVIIGSFKGRPFISLLSIDLIKQMCIKQAEWNYIKDPQIFQFSKIIFAGGLVFDEAQLWKKKRKILNQVFNFKFVAGFFDDIKRITNDTLDEQQLINQHEEEFKFCIREIGDSIFSKVTIEGFIGGNMTKERVNDKMPGQALVDLINTSSKMVLDVLANILGTKFVKKGWRKSDKQFIKGIQNFNSWALDFIQQRIEIGNKNIKEQGDAFEPKNIIQAILFENYKCRKNGKENQQYNLDDIYEEFKIFFFAGTDTTANMFNMMIFYIFSNPEVEQQLREEISRVAPDGQITYENTKQMKYLEAVQKETLRMGGPFNKNLIRKVVQDHYLNGVPIHKGINIQFMAYTAHFDQTHYQKPYEFRPERWINGECENLKSFAYVPFSGGNRSCIGKQLALMMSKISLILLMNRYKHVELESKQIKIHVAALFQGDKYEVRIPKDVK